MNPAAELELFAAWVFNAGLMIAAAYAVLMAIIILVLVLKNGKK